MKWFKTLLGTKMPNNEVSEEREDRFEDKFIKAMREEGFDNITQARMLDRYRKLRKEGYGQMKAIELVYDFEISQNKAFSYFNVDKKENRNRWGWIRWALLIAIVVIAAYFLIFPTNSPSEPLVIQNISEDQKAPEPEKTPDQICQAQNTNSYAKKELNHENGDFNFDAKRPFRSDEDARSIAKLWTNDTIGMSDTLLISVAKDINDMYMRTPKPTGADIEISALLKSQDPLFVDGCATDKAIKIKGYIMYLLENPDLTDINMVEIKKLPYSVKSLYIKDNSVYIPLRYGVSGDISDYSVEIIFRDKPTITPTGEKKPGKVIGRRGIDPNCHNWLKEEHKKKSNDNDKKDEPKCEDDQVYDNGKCLDKKTGKYIKPAKKKKVDNTDHEEDSPTDVITEENNNDIVDNAGVNPGSETGGKANGANTGSTGSTQTNEGGGTADGEVSE